MKIYIVPFLIDFILFVVQSRLSDAAGREMRLTNGQTTSLLVAFSLIYLLSCPLAARSLNPRSIKPILLVSLGALLLVCVPLLFVVSFWPALLLISGAGFVSAFAFNSFQAFMRGRSPQGEMSATVVKYNVSWSLGVGLGFLLSGVLLSFGQPMVLAALCSAAIVGIVAMIAGEKAAPDGEQALRDHVTSPENAASFDSTTLPENATSPDNENAASSTRLSPQPMPMPQTLQPQTAQLQTAQANLAPGAVDARYAAIGWVLCLTANFVQRPLATFIPKFSAQDGHSAWMAGGLLCALLWAQALGGLLTYRRANWLYSVRPLVLAQMGIVLSLCVLWVSHNYVLSLLAMIAQGVLQGWLFFCVVFYCSNSLRSVRDVGINEMMVGVGNIAGMVVCNLAIRWASSDLAFYPTTIAFSLLMIGVQLWWLRGAPVVASSSKETAAAI